MAKKTLKKKKLTGREAWDANKNHTITYDQHLRNKPFSPLATPYSTQGEFDDAVKTTAKGQLQPQLDDWERRRSSETMSHTGRMGDISSIYNAGAKARTDALQRTSSALNNLITMNSGVSDATKAAMMAALRTGQNREGAVAAEMGLADQPDGGQAYLDATEANNDLGGIGMTGQFSTILGGLGRDVGINEVERAESGRGEDVRWNAISKDLGNERTQLTDQLPALQEQARQNLSGTELARSGQAEQQRLGRKQFGLSKAQFDEQKDVNDFQEDLANRSQEETERQGRRGARQTNAQTRLGERAQTETERANSANEDINRKQIEAQTMQLKQDAEAKRGTEEGEMLKAKADRFSAGVSLISKFFTPTKQEQGKNKTKSTYTTRVTHGYDAMVSQLKSATGAGDIEVRQMIMAAVNPGTPYGKRWVDRASREIRTIKNSRVYRKPSGKDVRNPSNSPLGPK